MIVSYVLKFIYELELRLAGFDCKGISITWGSSTISDEVKSNRVDSIRFRTLTYFTRQVSFLNINMLGKWVMILLQKKNQEFHWKTNLLREVIQTHKRVLRRNRDRTIRINPLVDQEIK